MMYYIPLSYQKLLAQLANIEWNMYKSRLAADMNHKEQENYSKVHQKVNQAIYLKVKQCIHLVF